MVIDTLNCVLLPGARAFRQMDGYKLPRDSLLFSWFCINIKPTPGIEEREWAIGDCILTFHYELAHSYVCADLTLINLPQNRVHAKQHIYQYITFTTAHIYLALLWSIVIHLFRHVSRARAQCKHLRHCKGYMVGQNRLS